jgi:hypothetical protein
MPFEQCHRIISFMSGFNKPWFFAGGWAIDLFIGKQTRPHQDIEIAIFRSDQLHLKKYLKEWELKKVINGEFYPWKNEFYICRFMKYTLGIKQMEISWKFLLMKQRMMTGDSERI